MVFNDKFSLLKSHIDAYTRKDGAVVQAHDNSVQKKNQTAPTQTPEDVAKTKQILIDGLASAKWKGTPATSEQMEAAARYLSGRRSVDALKFAQAVGIPDGLALHLRKIQMAYFKNNSGGGGQSKADQLNSFFKQKPVGLIKH